MADRAASEREGWGVRPRGALLLVAGFFGALAVFIGVVALFFHLSTQPPQPPRPTADPAPQLQTAQRRPVDRLPGDRRGPPAPTGREAAAISAAMARLAAEGDAGWRPQAQRGGR